jgi:hypothetical protein
VAAPRAARSPELSARTRAGTDAHDCTKVLAEKRTTHGIAPAEQLLMRRINSADNATLITMEPRQPNRFEKKINIQRSPLSPCPRLALAFAFLWRSAASDCPTSSDSLDLAPLPRRTNRLSTAVSINSRLPASFLPVFFVAPPWPSRIAPVTAVQVECRLQSTAALRLYWPHEPSPRAIAGGALDGLVRQAAWVLGL